MVDIELLYFDGCPTWRTARAELDEVLAELGIDATVRLHRLESLEEAGLRGFAGSPTIRIDGRDLEDYDGPALLACRRYLDNDGNGWPDRTLLRRRLRDAGHYTHRQTSPPADELKRSDK